MGCRCCQVVIQGHRAVILCIFLFFLKKPFDGRLTLLLLSAVARQGGPTERPFGFLGFSRG